MEECNLLKERLQAITDKHRVQEDIRRKKLQLDQEKLKLQHLKKKSLREQWLLQDYNSHNAPCGSKPQRLECDQQYAKALQINIQRIQMEVDSLEREEDLISTNENFILKRLKTVERPAGDIINDTRDGFVPDPFVMGVGVSQNSLLGERALIRPSVETNQRRGRKEFHDRRSSAHVFRSQETLSDDQSSSSDLSSHEVEELLRSFARCQANNRLNLSRNEEKSNFYRTRSQTTETCPSKNTQDIPGGPHRWTERSNRENEKTIRRRRCNPERSPHLCYTPVHHTPLCVHQEALYSSNSPFYQSQNRYSQVTSPYRGSTHYDRVPSPLLADDVPFTILHSIDTSEPITAVFMGFHTTQDDGRPDREADGSIRAELVVIGDEREGCPFTDKGKVVAESLMEKQTGADRRKKHKQCCCVS
ncbi:palmdelphin-like [Gouania willdenowi]|uniref:palmdelphin-like n=1 Tax=Gouania willdenowi TaxID=441366 RepID=UPI00105470EB|nr:palmdelphin-like [Gouania willdenowi]